MTGAKFTARLLTVAFVVLFVASTVAALAHVHITGSTSECSFCFLSNAPADLPAGAGTTFVAVSASPLVDQPIEPDRDGFCLSGASRAPPLAA